jgi:hypothetical protein
VNFAAAAGHWVAWTDQSQVQSDTRANVRWRIWAKDLESGTTTLLATNGDRPDPYVPHIHSGSGHIFWATAETDRSARQWAWTPGAGPPRTLLRHVELSPDIESADRDHLVYLGASALPHHGRTVGGDCWALTFAGSDPVALTHTGLAMDCQAADGRLVWFTHIPPSYRPLPPDGVLDDPWEVWTKQLESTGSAVRLARGYIQGGSPAVGSGFAAWLGDGVRPFELHALDAQATTITLRGRALSPRVFAAEGSLLMLADQGASGRSAPTIRFIRVTRQTTNS